MITLIISFSSRGQREQHSPRLFCQRRVNARLFFQFFSLPLSLCAMWYIGDEPGVDGWWVELVEGGNQSGLSCSWSREKSCRWLAACLRRNVARGEGSTEAGWDDHHSWVWIKYNLCIFFSPPSWFCMSNVIISVLWERSGRRGREGDFCIGF